VQGASESLVEPPIFIDALCRGSLHFTENALGVYNV